jgi:hypothetical protein
MRSINILFCLLCLIFFSCGSSYEVIVQNDEDGCHVIHRMQSNNASADQRSLGMYGQIWVEGETFKSTGTEPSYYSLKVSCLITPGLNIQNDSSLTINIDNSQQTFSGMPTRYYSKEVGMAGSVYLLEKCTFQVQKELLFRIGSSHSVSFSLKGKDRMLNGTLPDISKKRFKLFYEEHVK